jgi:hypothetical protein
MTSKNRPSAEEENNLLHSSRSGKKPYHKPEFRSEKVFETVALRCGKIHPNQANCRPRFNQKNS